MKNLFISCVFCCLLLLPIFSRAQSFEFSNYEGDVINGQTIVNSTEVYGEYEFEYSVKNISEVQVSARITKSYIEGPVDGSFNTICSPATANSYSECVLALQTPVFILNGNELSELSSIHFEQGANSGRTKIKYEIVNIDSPSDKVSFILVFDTDPDIDTTIINESFCAGNVYNFYDSPISTAGVYFHTLTSVLTGNDSIIQLNLVENPAYLFQESATLCQGETYEWRGNIYYDANTYTETYYTANSECDSVYQLNLFINPLPQQVDVLNSPTNGILSLETNGQISLSTSYIGTVYWVTMGAANYAEEISGDGNLLVLGNNFQEGTYDIWSRNSEGCIMLQGTVTFVEDDGSNKITTNVSFGYPSINFPAGEVEVTLYKATLDIDNNPIVITVNQIVLGSNGQAVFEDLDEGDYYLGSAIVHPENYNVAAHVFYQEAITHEEAISIHVTENTIFIASIHHPQLGEEEGTNTGSGTVGSEGDNKSLIPEADMFVILYNDDTDEIVDVSITDINGKYNFSSIPDNTNFKMFVTSLEHQHWTPYIAHTNTGQNHNINFIIDGNSIYPEGYPGYAQEVEFDEIVIFPNPANETLHIIAPVDEFNVEIINLSGQTVINEFNSFKIDISGVPTGIYIVKVKWGEMIMTRKLIVE
jgi:hypothetical protein